MHHNAVIMASKQIGIRLDNDILRRIDERAAQTMRTRSNYIAAALQKHIADVDRVPALSGDPVPLFEEANK